MAKVENMTVEAVAAALRHAADCVSYCQRISKLPSCNDCGKAKPKLCEYLPAWGEPVRINCPFWVAQPDPNAACVEPEKRGMEG